MYVVFCITILLYYYSNLNYFLYFSFLTFGGFKMISFNKIFTVRLGKMHFDALEELFEKNLPKYHSWGDVIRYAIVNLLNEEREQEEKQHELKGSKSIGEGQNVSEGVADS
jgi:Arc/MetJ-type ribon-helix-helix transcriptional regulator